MKAAMGDNLSSVVASSVAEGMKIMVTAASEDAAEGPGAQSDDY